MKRISSCTHATWPPCCSARWPPAAARRPRPPKAVDAGPLVGEVLPLVRRQHVDSPELTDNGESSHQNHDHRRSDQRWGARARTKMPWPSRSSPRRGKAASIKPSAGRHPWVTRSSATASNRSARRRGARARRVIGIPSRNCTSMDSPNTAVAGALWIELLSSRPRSRAGKEPRPPSSSTLGRRNIRGKWHRPRGHLRGHRFSESRGELAQNVLDVPGG